MPTFFSLRLALAWTVMITTALWACIALAFLLFPLSAQSIVLLGAIQVLVYALVIVLFQTANGGSFQDLLALRKASPVLCLASAALGFTLQMPATLVSNGIEHFFPTAPAVLAERAARITPHSPTEAVAIFAVVAVLGPLAEEFFFRGVLFGALRRSYTVFVSATGVALLFAVGHLDARLLIPLFLTALVIGDLREQSGSIWPSVAVHGAFNAATLAVIFAGAAPNGTPPAVEPAVEFMGCLVCGSLFLITRRLALFGRVAQNDSSS